MKRLLSFLLSGLLLFFLTACGAGLESTFPVTKGKTEEKKTDEQPLYASKKEPKEETKLREEPQGTFDPTGFCAGFGRYKITPPKGTEMAGYGNSSYRLSDTVLDDLYVTCVAICDGENTALFFSVDVCSLPVSVWTEICTRLETELGIPKEYVFITATHTHAGPTVSTTSTGGSLLIPRAVKAAKDAIATLDKATILIGNTRTHNLSYVRRYLREDGSYVYRNTLPADASYPSYRHETEPDNEMLLIRLVRENQKDIVMVNWACHVTTAGSKSSGIVSADWVGVLREEVEKNEDVYLSYYQAAAGNTTPGTKLINEQNNSEDFVKHGKDIAAVVLEALPTLTSVETGKIRAVGSEIQIRYEKDLEGFSKEAIAAAGRVKELYSQGITGGEVTEILRKHGFISNHHAQSIYNRSQLKEDTKTMNLGAIAIGDLAFAYAPYEMLSTTGIQVKEGSEFLQTFMCGYTNGAFGYIPNKEAFPNRQYEVDSCRYECGTAEEIAAELQRLLKTLR